MWVRHEYLTTGAREVCSLPRNPPVLLLITTCVHIHHHCKDVNSGSSPASASPSPRTAKHTTAEQASCTWRQESTSQAISAIGVFALIAVCTARQHMSGPAGSGPPRYLWCNTLYLYLYEVPMSYAPAKAKNYSPEHFLKNSTKAYFFS